MSDTTPRPGRDAAGHLSAARLNEHLAAGGAVRVVTMTTATVYDAAGRRPKSPFSEDAKGGLYVTHGRRQLFLGPRTAPYVAVQVSRLPSSEIPANPI